MQPWQRLPRHPGRGAGGVPTTASTTPAPTWPGSTTAWSTPSTATQLDHESLVNLPDWLLLEFRTRRAWFSMDRAEVLDHTVTLDMRRGQLFPALRFRDGHGRVTRVTQRRLVHRGGRPPGPARDHLPARGLVGGDGGAVGHRRRGGELRGGALPRARGDNCGSSGPGPPGRRSSPCWPRPRAPASGSRRRPGPGSSVHGHGSRRTVEKEAALIAHRMVVPVVDGEEVTVEKVVAVFTSRPGHLPAGRERNPRARLDAGQRRPDRRQRQGVVEHLATHPHRHRTVRVVGAGGTHPPALPPAPGHLEAHGGLRRGLPARGLAGEAYRGHIFWDELFVFPYVNLRVPELAQALLMYRYRRLNEARRPGTATRASTGAMFPGRAAATARGDPDARTSTPVGHWMPDNSHLQRHVDAPSPTTCGSTTKPPATTSSFVPRRRADRRDRPVLGQPGRLRPHRRPL